MKVLIPSVAALGALALVSVSGVAQSAAYTGVSKPDPVVITAQPDEEVVVKVKPSAGTPASAPAVKPLAVRPSAGTGETYGAYVPYRGAAVPASESALAGDVDGQIVLGVEEKPGELGEGTLLRTRIVQGLSTVTTEAGTKFRAELTEPVTNAGRVVLPVGAVVEGRVTEVHGGRRISGAALLHLQPRSVTLPDGTHYQIEAQLIDTDQLKRSKVDAEGSLVRRDHPKETLAVIGGVTGGAATAGALMGGGVGAAVGAGIGAGAGTLVWLKQDRQEVLPKNALLIFSLTEPMELVPMSDGAERGAAPLAPRVRETATP